MSSINFQRTYLLGETYEGTKERAFHELEKYWGYPSLFTFDDLNRSVTFSSERLIPVASTNRPRVMLLFSNPHPHSIHQGMFLSPNTRGRENLFWSVMESAEWLVIEKRNIPPNELAEICIQANYRGPFEFIFYPYYVFPTDFPEDIPKIFGKEYFNRFIESEAADELKKTIQATSVDAVVAFNKGIFNLVAKVPVEGCRDRLMAGQLIQSQIKSVDRNVPVFLTYPTGWRYHKQYRQFRTASLDNIREAICNEINIPGTKNA